MVNVFIFNVLCVLSLTSFSKDVILIDPADSVNLQPLPKPIGYELGNSIETEPVFPGGMIALMEFVHDNLVYPVECVQGVVYVKFVITAEGCVDSVLVAKGVNPEMDAAAMVVVQAMPQWRPSTRANEKVAVLYTLPIQFKLSR